MIPTIVYTLCIFTCLGCALLLWRAYREAHSRLLLWSALCFLILGIANLLLFADLIIYPGSSLLALRSSVTLCGILVLLYGLIFESN
ncbi:MAG: DUF5985 family protein [Verrucomicrobiota bacterium]